jgi:putative transposase
MEKTKFTESQIVFALKQPEPGVKIEVGQSLTGEAVVSALEDIRNEEGLLPDRIQVDNGTEFTSKAFDLWAHENNVVIDYSRPGKPTDNPFIESFNGSFRDECLSTNWFLSLEDAKEKIEAFRQDYNNFRPHSSLSGLTPNQVIDEYLKDSNFSFLERY